MPTHSCRLVRDSSPLADAAAGCRHDRHRGDSGRLSAARAQFERRFVEVALARAGGNRTQAARELGLSRQGLLKMLERHNLT